MASRSQSSSPLSSFLQLVYLHLVLLLAVFGASDASAATKSRGGCPLSRLQVAFQAPLSSLSAALHGSTMSILGNQSPGNCASSSVNSFDEESPLPPRWVTDGAFATRPARVLHSRKINVHPLGMSAVETKQGTKRQAVDEPESQETKAEKKARRMTASSKPLGVHVIGLSHHNAGVEIREKLAVPEAEWNVASAKVCALFPLASYSRRCGVVL